MEHRVILTAAVSTFALALASCGNEGTTSDTPPAPSESAEGGSTEVVTLSPDAVDVPAAFGELALPEGDGPAALENFAAMDGAELRENGSVVAVLREGAGAQMTEDDLARVHFEGRVAGTDEPFGSSYRDGAPVTLTLDEALPGWRETLLTMKEGSLVRVALPPELAFGDRGIPGTVIGPNAVTLYDIELVDVIDGTSNEELNAAAEALQADVERFQQRAQQLNSVLQQQQSGLLTINGKKSANFIAEQAARPETIQTESGLVYEVVNDVEGDVTPAMGDTVLVNYRGTLPNGEEFDSSYRRGEPLSFELGRVIRGWNEGLQLMQPGDNFKFYIPAELAYGEQGTRGGPIGPNEALIFDVELLEVTPAETGDDAEE